MTNWRCRMLNNHWNSEDQNKALHKSNHHRSTERSSKNLAYYQSSCQQLKSHLKEAQKTNNKLEVYKNKDMQKSSEAKRSKQQT